MASEGWDIIPDEETGELTTAERRVGLRRIYDRQSRREDLPIDNCKVFTVCSGSEHERSQRRGKTRGHQHCDSKASTAPIEANLENSAQRESEMKRFKDPPSQARLGETW